METCEECGKSFWECQCPSEEVCVKHGLQMVLDAGAGQGFTGATIYFATLACGCQLIDDSGDSLEAVR